MRRILLIISLTLSAALLSMPLHAQSYLDPNTTQPYNEIPTIDSPILSQFDGGHITLSNLEEYVSEVTKLARVPRLVDGKMWREHMCRQLTKEVLFTSRALEMGLTEDPDLLRAREFWIQEWMSYAMLRDFVVNKIDASAPTLRKFYETHKEDYHLTPTVSLRAIRTRNVEKANTALARLKAGEPFEAVEKELSEASLRQRGSVLGPFPTTSTEFSIPPPNEVIEAAHKTEVNTTTGPLLVNNNYWIIKPVAKSKGVIPPFEAVVEFVETRIRQTTGDDISRKLLRQLHQELGVAYDDKALANPNTRPDDVIATVGTFLVTKDYFDSLGGRVRGPAVETSKLEPTRLSQFIVPLVFTQGAKLRGYDQRREFLKALFFYDLRRFGQRALLREVDRRTPRVTDAEIRAHYEEHKNEEDEHGHSYAQDSIETAQDNIREVLIQMKRGEMETFLTDEALTNSRFAMAPTPVCGLTTAFEAMVAAGAAGKIPPGHSIRMISSYPDFELAGVDNEGLEPINMTQGGRRNKWRILVSPDADTSTVKEIIWDQPARMYDASDKFTSAPVFNPFRGVWRFDTDALIRLAYDQGMADFFAKHFWNVHVNTRVEVTWAQGRVDNCWVVFEMRSLNAGASEVLTMRFDAATGSMSRKPLTDCLPCEQMKRLLNEPI